MTRDKALEFCAGLQRLMKRSKISSIESGVDGRIILHDEYGRRCASFEGIDVPAAGDDSPLSEFVRDLSSSEAACSPTIKQIRELPSQNSPTAADLLAPITKGDYVRWKGHGDQLYIVRRAGSAEARIESVTYAGAFHMVSFASLERQAPKDPRAL